ncbi:Flagellar hook-associated protein 1 [Phycisphaerae bacterium RAS2]|nr:Flagellar hook-associated protein 1 [Phycisphaerae bacterium RAS2]
MGLSSALGIGRSALAAYQAALQVVGHNIANAGTPGYARNVANLSAVPGASLGVGQVGYGVTVTGVRRNVSEALNARLRTAGSNVQSSVAQRDVMARIEGIFNPLGDTNLGSLMGEFFKTVGDLQNNPQNTASRSIVTTSAGAVIDKIRSMRTDLLALRTDANREIEVAVQQADQLASQIASLNVQISTAEASSGGTAAGLRDQRDQLLGQLSDLFEITVREQPSGAINVYLGNDALIQFGESFGLKTTTEIDANGLASVVVRYKHHNGPVDATSGRIPGLITARDSYGQSQLDRLDAMASALIHEVNKLHASGKGLQGFSSVMGTYAATDPSLALSATGNGITFPPKTGSFFIDVKDDATGVSTRHQVHIDLDGIGSDSSLNSVAADITANVPGVTATVLADGRLQLSSAAGSTFSFADDTSGFLAAVGVNTFFAGSTSRDIEINSVVKSNVAFLAAGKTDLPGDGSNATDIAALQNKVVTALGASLNEYYASTVAEIAVTSASTQGAYDAGAIVFESLTNQRESISGVNMDEEAISMITYQRAYEGAARYMTVVDEMLQVLLGIVR